MKKYLVPSLLALAACTALAASAKTPHISAAADAAATNAMSASSMNTPVAQVLVDVTGAWARSTKGGQKVSGAYMTLTAKQDGVRLIGASSALARKVEIHEMRMDGEVMRMKRLPELVLPKDQGVQLAPGAYHLMLFGLKQTLPERSMVPITLEFVDAKGLMRKLTIQLPAYSSAPPVSIQP